MHRMLCAPNWLGEQCFQFDSLACKYNFSKGVEGICV